MPQMKPQMLMTSSSVIECFFVRSMRGSTSVENFSISEAVAGAGCFFPTVDQTCHSQSSGMPQPQREGIGFTRERSNLDAIAPACSH